jgi:anti-anti-sigma factor
MTSTTVSTESAAFPTVVGMAVTIEPIMGRDGDLRIHLTGELDAWSAPTLTMALAGLQPSPSGPRDQPQQIVLDLHELSFLDTSGLAALEAGRAALLTAGWCVEAGPAQPQVCRLLRFADREGWLVDGPMAAEQSAASHLHVVATPTEHRRPPEAVRSVPTC